MSLPELPKEGGKPVKPWNIKQIKFVHAYIANGHNATKAAISAGYGKDTAARIGSRLLTYVHISAAIGTVTAQALERVKVSVDEVLFHHKAMGHSNIKDFLEFDKHGRPHIRLDKATREQCAAVKTIKVTELPAMTVVENGQELKREVLKIELTLHDKRAANRDLMEHTGILNQAAPAGDVTNIQNNIYVGADPVEICKRMALALFRGTMPKVVQPGAGSNTGSSEVISTTGTSGSTDSAKPPQS